METILFWVISGVVIGFIGQSKGRSFFKWWLWGTLMSLVAFVHVLCVKDISGLTECHACKELIKSEATLCKHCGTKLKEESQ